MNLANIKESTTRLELDDIIKPLIKLSKDVRSTAKAKMWCLTYKQHMRPSSVNRLVTAVMSRDTSINNSIVEFHAVNCEESLAFPYEHAHILVKFNLAIRVHNLKTFDYKESTPHIRTISTLSLWKNCVLHVSQPEKPEEISEDHEDICEDPEQKIVIPACISDLRIFRDPALPSKKPDYASARMHLEYRGTINRDVVHEWWVKFIKKGTIRIVAIEHNIMNKYTHVLIATNQPLRIRCDVRKLEIKGIAPVLRSIVSDKQWDKCVSYVRQENDTVVKKTCKRREGLYKDIIIETPYTPITVKVFTPWQTQLQMHMQKLVHSDSVRDELVKKAFDTSDVSAIANTPDELRAKITVVYSKTEKSGRLAFATAYKEAYNTECWNCSTVDITSDLFVSADTEFSRGWTGQTLLYDMRADTPCRTVYKSLRTLSKGIIPGKSNKENIVYRPACVVVMTRNLEMVQTIRDTLWDVYHIDGLYSDLVQGAPVKTEAIPFKPTRTKPIHAKAIRTKPIKRLYYPITARGMIVVNMKPSFFPESCPAKIVFLVEQPIPLFENGWMHKVVENVQVPGWISEDTREPSLLWYEEGKTKPSKEIRLLMEYRAPTTVNPLYNSHCFKFRDCGVCQTPHKELMILGIALRDSFDDMLGYYSIYVDLVYECYEELSTVQSSI